jgi:hypothetical protein
MSAAMSYKRHVDMEDICIRGFIVCSRRASSHTRFGGMLISTFDTLGGRIIEEPMREQYDAQRDSLMTVSMKPAR